MLQNRNTDREWNPASTADLERASEQGTILGIRVGRCQPMIVVELIGMDNGESQQARYMAFIVLVGLALLFWVPRFGLFDTQKR